METYIAKYGYIGIFIGTFLEGETTVLLGGIFSKLGYMTINKVVLWAFLGTFIGDCTFFGLGRVFGRNYIEKYEFLRSKIPLANKIIKKHGNFIIFFIRFLVGIRAIILLLLGCTNIRLGKFMLFNAINSILWSIAVTLTGYIFGNVVYVFVKDIKKYENYIVPVILAAVTILILIYRHIVQARERKSYGNE
ncbi:MAG: DedA family protein [Proteobacteria bacterium]|nr:DedA family protein [Pseudomonadota bacterium]